MKVSDVIKTDIERLVLLWLKKGYIRYRKRKRTASSQKDVENLDQGGKKLAVLDKRSWFNQDVFWDEIEERITKRMT